MGEIGRAIRALLVAVVVLVGHVAAVHSRLKFALPAAGSKCFYEELPLMTEVRGEVALQDGSGELTCDLFISRVTGGTVLFSKRKIVHEKFKFTTPTQSPQRGRDEGGVKDRERFRFCFINQGRPSANEDKNRMILFKLKTAPKKEVVQAHEKETMRKDANRVSTSLDHALDLFEEVTDGIEFMMKLESELYEASESTSKTVLIYSIFSCVFLVLVGIYGFYVAKTYIKQLKVV